MENNIIYILYIQTKHQNVQEILKDTRIEQTQ